MVDISLKSNIKKNLTKNLTKTAVSAKQNETKAQETAKPAVVETSAKTTAKQVVSGITKGTASTAKTVSTIKNDLKTEVKATKTGKLTTVTTKLDNKAVKITTNAEDVPITVSNNKIDTAKTLKTGLTPKVVTPQIKDTTPKITKDGKLSETVNGGKTKETGSKDEAGKSGSLDIVSFERFCALYKDIFSELSEQDLKTIYDVLDLVSKNKPVDGELLSKAYDIIAGLDEDTINKFFESMYGSSSTSQNNNAPMRAPSKKGGEPAVGPRGEYGGDGWFGDYGTDGYVSFGACCAHEWDMHGGMENWNGKGAEEMATGVLLGAFIEWTCLNVAHGAVHASDALVENFNKGVNNFISTFTIPGSNSNTGKQGFGLWPDYKGGDSDFDWSKTDWNKVVPPTTRPTDSSDWTKGYKQYDPITIDTGNGTSVEFGKWTAIGTSENDNGGFDAIYTDANGNPVVIPGADGNGSTHIDGAGGVNNHKPGETWVDANGTECTLGQDGSLTCKYKNGVTIVYLPDGSEVRIEPNGDVKVTPPTDNSGNGGGSGTGGTSGTGNGGSSGGQSDPLTNTLTGLAAWASTGGNQSLADALNAYINGGCQGNFTWTSGNSSGTGNGSTGGTGGAGGSNGSNGSNGSGWGSIMDGVLGTGGSSGNQAGFNGYGSNPHGGGGSGGGGGGYSNPYDPWGGTSNGYYCCGKWIGPGSH